MGKFIVGVIIGFLLVPAGFYLYVRSGRAPVATSAPPMPFEEFFANTALHATLSREAPKTRTTKASDGELLAGVEVYRHHCGGCHGLPGKPMSGIAKGEFPPPPQLFEPDHMVTDDPTGVTYWKVKHGIRLTGMPGFQASLTDEQIWNVSLLLANADKMPPDVSQALTAPFGPPPPAAPPTHPAAKPNPRRK
ncbi:MAG TPA: c-type cytochrome [Terriglobia bacterium]|nr:c-type cytochrome [Terriglobia bacterium]